MPRKSSVNKKLVIELFKNGLTYGAIALKVNSTEDAIRKLLKRNAPELMRKRINTKDVIVLMKEGFTYKEIAVKVNSTEDAVRKHVSKYAAKELSEIKKIKQRSKVFEPVDEEVILETTGDLTIKDRLEMMEEKRYGINPNESMTERNFVIWNRHSYLTDKEGRLHFDETRGAITKDVPSIYNPVLI